MMDLGTSLMTGLKLLLRFHVPRYALGKGSGFHTCAHMTHTHVYTHTHTHTHTHTQTIDRHAGHVLIQSLCRHPTAMHFDDADKGLPHSILSLSPPSLSLSHLSHPPKHTHTHTHTHRSSPPSLPFFLLYPSPSLPPSLTILSQGWSRPAASSSSSLYCTSSHSLWRALSGSFRETGIDIRERASEKQLHWREGGREGGSLFLNKFYRKTNRETRFVLISVSTRGLCLNLLLKLQRSDRDQHHNHFTTRAELISQFTFSLRVIRQGRR